MHSNDALATLHNVQNFFAPLITSCKKCPCQKDYTYTVNDTSGWNKMTITPVTTPKIPNCFILTSFGRWRMQVAMISMPQIIKQIPRKKITFLEFHQHQLLQKIDKQWPIILMPYPLHQQRWPGPWTDKSPE